MLQHQPGSSASTVPVVEQLLEWLEIPGKAIRVMMDRQRVTSILFGGWAGAASLVLLTVLLLLLVGGFATVLQTTRLHLSLGLTPVVEKVILGLVTMLRISAFLPKLSSGCSSIFRATVALLVGLLLYKLAVGGVVRWIRCRIPVSAIGDGEDLHCPGDGDLLS